MGEEEKGTGRRSGREKKTLHRLNGTQKGGGEIGGEYEEASEEE